MMMEVEKVKAFDLMFNEHGFAEEEIARAVKEYDLLKDPDFLEMQKEMQAKLQATMQVQWLIIF